MRGVLAVAVINFKRAIRDKFFFGVVFFFLFYLVFSAILGEMSWGHQEKVLRDAGLVGIELTAIILIIFSLIFSFFREKETRILEVYLTNFRPSVYISGKIVSYWLISLVYLFFSAPVYSLMLYFYDAFSIAPLVALYPLFLKIAIMVCFSSLFSCLFSSPNVALLSSLFVYITSILARGAVKMVATQGSLAQQFLVRMVYAFLPDMDKLDIKALAVYGSIPSGKYFLTITLYALVYILCLWLINLYIFSKKEY